MPSLAAKILRGNAVKAFMKGKAQNAWIEYKGYDVYLRKNSHRGQVELANIVRKDGEGTHKVLDKKDRPKRGRFHEVLSDVEEAAKKAKYKHVLVENVHNKFLPDELNGVGYHQQDMSLAPSYRKRLL
jgi:hypothetical protein